MKIICEAEKLLECINRVQRAVSVKTTMPILEGILIEVNDRVRLIGNDLELAIECFVEADILSKGSIIVNSKIFGDIIRKMPSDDILLELQEGNIIYIECDNTYFKIKGVPSTGFPSLPCVDKRNEFSIDSKIFRDMVRQTIFAASTDESQPIFTGMLVELKNQNLSIVAADKSARMAYRREEVKENTTEFSAIIPARTLNEISKMLQHDEINLTLCIGNSHIIFKFGECTVMSRIIDGKYINYRSIIREDYESKIVVDRKRLLSSIERAMLISFSDKKHPVMFNINEDRLNISCKTELGEISDEFAIDMDGKKMNIGFNPQYFIECLRAIDDEYVEILFATKLGPATIKPPKDDKYTYLIGAVRI